MRQQFPIFCALIAIVAAGVALSRAPISDSNQSLNLQDEKTIAFDDPLWTCSNGNVVFLSFAPTDEVFAVLIGHPPDRVNFQLLVMDVKTKATLLDVRGIYPTNLCFSEDGHRIAVRWSDAPRIYALDTGETLFELESYRPDLSNLHPMAFSKDGKTIVMTTEHYIKPPTEMAWDIQSGAVVEFTGEMSNWSGRGYSPDGSMVAEGGWPGPTPRIHHRRDGHRIAYCFRHPYHIFATFTPDSQNFFTIHEDGAMFLWDVKDMGNENAAILQSEFQTGLEKSSAFALLNKTPHLAYVDSEGHIRIRRLF